MHVCLPGAIVAQTVKHRRRNSIAVNLSVCIGPAFSGRRESRAASRVCASCIFTIRVCPDCGLCAKVSRLLFWGELLGAVEALQLRRAGKTEKMEETKEGQQNSVVQTVQTVQMGQVAQTTLSTAGSRATCPPLRQGKRHSRKDDILKVFVKLLEEPKCDRITTAQIAKQLGVSEAALYRSFPSKAAMFDALINYIEDSLMAVFGTIRADARMSCAYRIQTMASVVLDFAVQNPGFMRILTGQVLMKEDPRLSERVALLIDKIEMSFRQAYREAVLAKELPANFDATGRANTVMCWLLGRLQRYVITNFRVRPNGVSEMAFDIFLSH